MINVGDDSHQASVTNTEAFFVGGTSGAGENTFLRASSIFFVRGIDLPILPCFSASVSSVMILDANCHLMPSRLGNTESSAMSN